ncbi:MAG: ABC transporter substrate-binding protein [Microvirga sp.]
MARVTRRKFLKVSGAGALAAKTGGMAAILATGRAPAYAQATTLNWLRWNDFVPASDQLLRKELIPEGEKVLGIKINLETVNGNDLQPRITSAIQSGAGPDLFMLFNNHPHLYAASAVDLSDIAEDIGKTQGGWYKVSSGNCNDGKKWLSMPFCIIGAMNAYRKSWFEEVGYSKYPETWDEFRDAGKKLKAKGHPIGQALGHSFGDPPTFAYPLMWSYGGNEVDESGKVIINSKETIESVKYMVALWKEACDEGGLAWDDSSNNRAFLSGTISSTLNGASIYIEAMRKPDQYKTEKGAALHTDILHAPLPKGPAGQFGMHTFESHLMPSYSKNQKAAKDFLRWMHTPANYEKWFNSQKGFATAPTADWEKSKMWEENPVMLPFKVAGRLGELPGRKGLPNARAGEVLSKYVIVDMYAKAVQGGTAEEAVAWAEGELKKVYV